MARPFGFPGLTLSNPHMRRRVPSTPPTSNVGILLLNPIVHQGITSKEPHLVAAILAQREASVSPSTIGRQHKVHHTTVGRILSAAELTV